MWHVTNNMLYSGSGTSNPVFIVATSYNFGRDGESNTADWTNFESNRAQAGNAVHMYGSYLAGHNESSDGISGGQRVIDQISLISSIPFFSVEMNIYDIMWKNTDDDWIPRGSHTPKNTFLDWYDSGHWNAVPIFCSGDNKADSDDGYVVNYSGDSTKWTNSAYWGTMTWHSNWLNRIKTGTAGGSSQYGKLFSWHLMDEPFNPDKHRDAVSNQLSVQAHYGICSNIESTDSKPKLIGLAPSTGGTLAETGWTNLSGNMDIVCGNNYGYFLATTSSRIPWTTVNMTKWLWSKVSGSSTKMVMSWLPGYANSNQDSTPSNGANTCWYTFYGSIIEGARGVLWYMTDDISYSNYTNYAVLTNIYPAFTNNRMFKGGLESRSPDEEVILNGSNVGVSWVTNPSLDLDGAGFPFVLSNKFSALVMKYNSRYRLYIVNNNPTTNSENFVLRIDNNELYNSGWSNAYDQNGNLTTMTIDGGLPYRYRLSGALSGYQLRIYDFGAGNQ